MNKLDDYGQYKKDIFTKLNFSFQSGKKILDIGCGDGMDSYIFKTVYKLKSYCIDIFKHDNFFSKLKSIKFKKAGIDDIPYPDDFFDYIFIHDVLHHIDENNQRFKLHLQALKETLRVCKKSGTIIIIEGNRFNPLFYPHMVKLLGHDHWTQSYFKKTIRLAFKKHEIKYQYFEAHNYPNLISFWKIYEKIMEKIVPKAFIAYNVAIIKKNDQ